MLIFSTAAQNSSLEISDLLSKLTDSHKIAIHVPIQEVEFPKDITNKEVRGIMLSLNRHMNLKTKPQSK